MGIRKTKKQKFLSIRDKHEKGELAKEILRGLAVGGLIIASFILPNLPQVFSLFGVKNSKDRYKINRALKLLEKQELINLYEKDGEMFMKITEKGNKKTLKYQIDELRLSRPKEWDKKWRIVAFDIPEKYRRSRDAVNLKLKELEFYPLQKSIFICPFECKDEIDFIGEFFNIRKYIKYLIADKIEESDRDYLKIYYNL
jgi:DNA-binding transcriptional regulator PaaX